MKKRITAKQLIELSDEEKISLREMWTPCEGDMILELLHNGEFLIHCLDNPGGKTFCTSDVNWTYEEYYRTRKDICLPMLDIAAMIEIIEMNNGFKEYFDSGTFREWNYSISLDWNGREEGIELCDRLWEAVKDILNKEAKPEN